MQGIGCDFREHFVEKEHDNAMKACESESEPESTIEAHVKITSSTLPAFVVSTTSQKPYPN